jgi:hypothetical protein
MSTQPATVRTTPYSDEYIEQNISALGEELAFDMLCFEAGVDPDEMREILGCDCCHALNGFLSTEED